MSENRVIPGQLMTDFDVSLFQSGKHFRLYEKMGAQPGTHEGKTGCYFTVYAPNAFKVCIIGDFNQWNGEQYVLYPRWDKSGLWEGFIPGVNKGMNYKYEIYPYNFGRVRHKSDPYGFMMEMPPMTATIIWDTDFEWNDNSWMSQRQEKNSLSRPHSVYEIHFVSWKQHETEKRPLTYIEAADVLVPYVKEMGFTHVEFMPLAEHPYEPSWGYQVSGYFAATSRFGSPQDLMYLIYAFHQNDIGVIMDWVPAHFPADDFALATFDGSCVYEHPDQRKGFHPDWNTLIFNYERGEVRSFLISNAFFWMDKYHMDGIRVDAVSSIIYLNYSRKDGEWEPNKYGGREYIDAISFIQECNQALYRSFPGIQTIAEESTDFPLVTRPPESNGLGFGMKWMMGWMHDTLDYFKREFIFRRFHQNDITFSIMYAFSENFMLALSHDEVVHGKASLLGKMAGDEWQKFANLRTLYGYMFTHPGTKLLFMGSEIAPYTEWNFESFLPWELLKYAPHKGIQMLVKDLNTLYTEKRALYFHNFSYQGFEWINAGDYINGILIYKRKTDLDSEDILVICNLQNKPHESYKIGISEYAAWELLLNTDDKKYWGSGYICPYQLSSIEEDWQGYSYHIPLDIPPLCTLIFGLKMRYKPKKKQSKSSKKSSTSAKKESLD